MPWGEDGQRAQQAHPGAGRARPSLRSVQTGQLVGAARREDVAFTADQFGQRRVVEPEGLSQLRKVPYERGEAAVRDDHRMGRMEAADHVQLGVLDDGFRGCFLTGRLPGHVVVAFDRRAVVGIDRRPAAAPPQAPVA